MQKVIYVFGLIGDHPSIHACQYIRETHGQWLERFVTTSDLAHAKRFKSDLDALRFLRHCNPKPSIEQVNGCYELGILDLDVLKAKLKLGLAPRTLLGTAYALRVLGTPLSALKPSTPPQTHA
jgi:hypothetical protein